MDSAPAPVHARGLDLDHGVTLHQRITLTTSVHMGRSARRWGVHMGNGSKRRSPGAQPRWPRSSACKPRIGVGVRRVRRTIARDSRSIRPHWLALAHRADVRTAAGVPVATRTKRGRTHVTSSPQRASEGRRAAVAPLDRERMPRVQGAAGVAVQLALAHVELRLASPDERDRAARRVRHTRHRLRQAAGRAIADQIERQLVADGGRVLRGAQLGSDAMRSHALASAVTLGAIAAEHNVRSVVGMVLLGLAARWHALAHVALDDAMAGTGDDATARARYASQELRLALLGALQLERQARDVGAAEPEPIDVAGAVSLAEQRARELEPDSDEPDSDDEPPAPEDDEPTDDEPTPALGFGRGGHGRGGPPRTPS